MTLSDRLRLLAGDEPPPPQPKAPDFETLLRSRLGRSQKASHAELLDEVRAILREGLFDLDSISSAHFNAVLEKLSR